MDINTEHNIIIEGDSDTIEAIAPLMQDLTTLVSAVESKGPATKAPIVDECRYELAEVMQENSNDRIVGPGDVLDLLATYGIVQKEGEKFKQVHRTQ